MHKSTEISRAKPADDIRQSTQRFEAWLAAELGPELRRKDLDRKHERMTEGEFPFLRATYWRWAELAPALMPELMACRAVLAGGDIHLENFGTWRDAEGRLVWGVNDHDEAAEMPWPLDLVRLVTSAILAGAEARPTAGAVLAGYALGLGRPAPFVLEREHAWLRAALVVPESERRHFWDKLAPKSGKPSARWLDALRQALPPGAEGLRVWPRVAGTGSLGRPRWVALAEWRGGAVVREAKAMVPSGWVLAQGGARALRVAELATGAFRVPDPWFGVHGHVAVRRLSPNNRKVELAGNADLLLSPRMLSAMGQELANIHRGSTPAAPVLQQLRGLKRRWLERAATRAAERMAEEQHHFAKG